MKTRVFLIVSENGSVQARKNLPSAGIGEVVFQLKIEIPNTVFRRSIADVDIVIPESAIVRPVIDLVEQSPAETEASADR